jgi:hypothetical protein
MQPQDYATAITASWRGSTQAILDACNAAMQAKADGCLASVAALVSATVDRSTLARLAIIGECRALYAADPAMLPPAWGTLYEMTKVANLADRLASGEINPRIARSVVTSWHRAPNPAAGAIVASTTAAPATVPATLEDVIGVLGKMRKAGAKPADMVGKVKPADLRLAITFLQAIEAASKVAGATP